MTSKASTLLYGIHSVQSLLDTHPEKITRLFVLQGRHDQKLQDIIAAAKQEGIDIEQTPRHELDRLTQQANHQGVVAQCKKDNAYTENDLQGIIEKNPKPLLLILDGVQDPHNLGACLRSADAAGVHAVIAPKDKSVGITPTVSKVASGAAESVPFIQVTNLARTLREIKEYGIWVFGAAGEAKQTIYQANFKVPTAIVLGAEGSGLRRLTRDHCDELLNIPMAGSVSSLNVSVATGIFLFEAVRQRLL